MPQAPSLNVIHRRKSERNKVLGAFFIKELRYNLNIANTNKQI